jgi:FkbM family methyltransferase
MKLEKIEDSLNGKFSGLYGEVVTCDTYKLRMLDFSVSKVIDIGANVGVFSRFARELFPEALIVSVEPNKSNCEVFRQFTNDDKIILINKAIGIGKIYHGLTAANGSGETYLSEGLGYPEGDMNQELTEGSTLELSDIETIMPDEIINTYIEEGEDFILKIDIEGAENTIWTHEPSMIAIAKAKYLCMEIHRYALNGGQWQEVQDKTDEAIEKLRETHDVEIEGVHLWAYKKQ